MSKAYFLFYLAVTHTATGINQNISTLGFNTIIEGCGGYVDGINGLIRQAKGGALVGASDAHWGTTSRYGYLSMFKKDESIWRVTNIYNSIIESKKLPGLIPNPENPKSPHFACATGNSQYLVRKLNLNYDPRERCRWGGPQSTSINTFYAEGTAYIFLCPSFFKLQRQADRPHCPAVHEDRFAGDPKIFYKRYQIYTLFYELVRFYLGRDALSDHSDPHEELDWNNCVRLGVEASVRNPTNYQIYVACKAIPFIFSTFLSPSQKEVFPANSTNRPQANL